MIIKHSSTDQRYISFGGKRWRWGFGEIFRPSPTFAFIGRLDDRPHITSWIARVGRFAVQISKLSGPAVHQ